MHDEPSSSTLIVKSRRGNEVFIFARSFAIAIAVALYFFAFLARGGVGATPSIIPLLLAVTILLIPEAVEKWSSLTLPLLQMLALLFFFIIGWVGIFLQVDLTIVVYACFISSLYVNFKKRIFSIRKSWGEIFFWLMALLLACMITGQVWTQDYLNPLTPEAFSVGLNFVHRDTLFHAALTAMIKTYHIASTGIFGLQPITYHSGSHFLFAPLIELCHTDTLQFYNIGFPVLFIPLFCQGMLLASFSSFKGSPSQFRRLVSVFCLFFVLCETTSSAFGNYYFLPTTLNTHFLSESYCVSLIYTFFAIAIYFNFLFKDEALHSNNTINIILQLAFAVWVFIIGYTKLSTGVIVLGAFSYVVFRRKLFTQKWILISTLLSALTIFYVLTITVESHQDTFNIQWGAFYNVYIKGPLPIYFLLNNLLLIVFAVAVFLVRKKNQLVLSGLISGRFIVLETILFVGIIGILPGLLIHIDGASALYFSDIRYWFSAIALMSVVPNLIQKFKANKNKVSPAIKSSILIIAISIAGISLFSFIRKNVQIRTALAYGKDIKFKDQIKIAPLWSLFKDLGPGLRKSPEYQKQVDLLNLNVFQSLRSLPWSVKEKSIVYCEDEDVLDSFLPCTSAIFYLPTSSELAMINGLKWKDCFDRITYGMADYQRFPKEVSKEESFKLAKQNGFENIIILSLKSHSFKIVKL